MTDQAIIQIQDISGNWRPVQSVIRNDQVINHTITQVARQYKKPVRAVDAKGNLLQQGGL